MATWPALGSFFGLAAVVAGAVVVAGAGVCAAAVWLSAGAAISSAAITAANMHFNMGPPWCSRRGCASPATVGGGRNLEVQNNQRRLYSSSVGRPAERKTMR